MQLQDLRPPERAQVQAGLPAGTLDEAESQLQRVVGQLLLPPCPPPRATSPPVSPAPATNRRNTRAERHRAPDTPSSGTPPNSTAVRLPPQAPPQQHPRPTSPTATPPQAGGTPTQTVTALPPPPPQPGIDCRAAGMTTQRPAAGRGDASAAYSAQRRAAAVVLRRPDHRRCVADRRGQPGARPALGPDRLRAGLPGRVRKRAPGHPALRPLHRPAAAADSGAAQRTWPGDDPPARPCQQRAQRPPSPQRDPADAVDPGRCCRVRARGDLPQRPSAARALRLHLSDSRVWSSWRFPRCCRHRCPSRTAPRSGFACRASQFSPPSSPRFCC